MVIVFWCFDSNPASDGISVCTLLDLFAEGVYL